MPWEELLGRAARIDLPERDFWQMTHAQFLRAEKAWQDRKMGQFFDMLNALGSVWHGKDWTWQEPGKDSRKENFDRMKAAMAALNQRRREKHG